MGRNILWVGAFHPLEGKRLFSRSRGGDGPFEIARMVLVLLLPASLCAPCWADPQRSYPDVGSHLATNGLRVRYPSAW